jgi:hypothetical protein
MTSREIKERVSEGVRDYYKEFQRYIGEPAIAVEILARTREHQGFSSYVDVLVK